MINAQNINVETINNLVMITFEANGKEFSLAGMANERDAGFDSKKCMQLNDSTMEEFGYLDSRDFFFSQIARRGVQVLA
jgi:hypothetical protein